MAKKGSEISIGSFTTRRQERKRPVSVVAKSGGQET
jgi:hypothetical protein